MIDLDAGDDDTVEIDPSEVWSINWDSFRVFVALATQWRAVGVGRVILRTGLRYDEVDRMIERMGVDRAVFWDVQVMEAVALPILNEVDE